VASQIAEVALRRKVWAKSDSYYAAVDSLAGLAREAFPKDKAQIRNLENTANSASKIADVLDFVKRQTGRRKKWRNGFGEGLLAALGKPMQADAQSIVDSVSEEIDNSGLTDEDVRRTRILLCREYIRHLSASYLYRIGVTPAAATGESDDDEWEER
jgi:hypothetical protein